MIDAAAACDPEWERILQADREFAFLEDRRAVRRLETGAQGSGPLAGQIIGVKSNIAVQGHGWSAGIAARADQIAPGDAGVVAVLRAAGARMLPRLKMDEAALGAACDNPHFGVVDNPARPGFSAGGSSGGSAAAVASGAVRLALGTDTLGSVRIPAAYCGVVGLKPAPGRMPIAGVMPLAPSYDAVGVLGASLAEVAMLYRLFDPAPVLSAGLRLMVPTQCADIPCTPETRAALNRAEHAAWSLGCLSDTIPLLGWDPEQTRKAAFAEIAHLAARSLSGEPGISDGLRRSLDYGARIPAEQLEQGAQHLGAVRDGLAEVFAAGLVLLTPTTPSGSFAHGTRPPRDQASFTALANIAGAASLAVPVPTDGALSSVLLTGAAGSEAGLLALACDLLGAMTDDRPV